MASDYAPTPVEDFLDPDDPTLLPPLKPEQVEYLAKIATQMTFAHGQLVFEHGQPETPLYVALSGALDVIDQAPEGDRYFTQCREGTFAADISMFTGEPTLAAGFAAEPTSLLALPPEDVRRVVATTAELGDLLLRTMVTRREWLQGRGLGQQRLIGSRRSGEAFAVRELLERNLVPFTWHDLATDEESRVLLDGLGIGDADRPVLVRSDSVIRRATVTSVADELGLRAQVDGQSFDVVVLGGGSAGLAAAVYAASGGLSGGVRDDRRLSEVRGRRRLRRPGRQGVRDHRRGGAPARGLLPALGRGEPRPADARVHASRRLCHRRRPQRLDQARCCGRWGRRAGGPLHSRLARSAANLVEQQTVSQLQAPPRARSSPLKKAPTIFPRYRGRTARQGFDRRCSCRTLLG
jgi:CRP-like cAMP-binding protein